MVKPNWARGKTAQAAAFLGRDCGAGKEDDGVVKRRAWALVAIMGRSGWVMAEEDREHRGQQRASTV